MKHGVISHRRWILCATAAALLAVPLTGCAHGDSARPPEDEFGLDGRRSVQGHWLATAEPLQPIPVGSMHQWILKINDAEGSAVEGAQITIDGGMPEHGHGLPTRPRVTRAVGPGAYQVDGLRFNMRGWWEVTFHVTAAGIEDSITFNLDL